MALDGLGDELDPELITGERIGNVHHFTIRGELDAYQELGGILDAVYEALRADPPPSSIRFDISGVKFMDSTGLRAIIDSDNAAQEHGVRLVLVEPPEQAERVIHIVNLDQHIKVEGGMLGSGEERKELPAGSAEPTTVA